MELNTSLNKDPKEPYNFDYYFNKNKNANKIEEEKSSEESTSDED